MRPHLKRRWLLIGGLRSQRFRLGIWYVDHHNFEFQAFRARLADLVLRRSVGYIDTKAAPLRTRRTMLFSGKAVAGHRGYHGSGVVQMLWGGYPVILGCIVGLVLSALSWMQAATNPNISTPETLKLEKSKPQPLPSEFPNFLALLRRAAPEAVPRCSALSVIKRGARVQRNARLQGLRA